MNLMRWTLLVLLCLGPARAHASSVIGPDFTRYGEQVAATTVQIQVERGPLIAAGLQRTRTRHPDPSPRADRGDVQDLGGERVIFDAEEGLGDRNHHVINSARTFGSRFTTSGSTR